MGRLDGTSRDCSPNMSRANASSVPFKSDSEIPSPTTSPSICENIGVRQIEIVPAIHAAGATMRIGGVPA
jgi:hypothetical protein